MSTDGTPLLRVDAVAERLDVSRRTVYRKIEAGQIPALRLGSSPGEAIRVPEAELLEWLFREPRDDAA